MTKSGGWGRWPVYLVLLLAVILVIWLVQGGRPEFRWDLFGALFVQIEPGWLAAAIGLIFLTYVGRALRWQVMMRAAAPHAKLNRILSATIIGFTAVTLFGRPGELVRPYLIAKKEKVGFASQIGVWLLERIYDLLIVILLFGFALARLDPARVEVGSGLHWMLQTGGWLVAVIGTICVIVLFVLSRFSEAAERRINAGLAALPERYRERLQRVTSSFVTGMGASGRENLVLLLLVYSVLEWAVIIASNYCIFQGLPVTKNFTLMDTTIFVSFIAFGGVVQIPGVGGGMQIAAVLILTELFGLTLETASGIAILIWLTTYATVVPPGLWLAFREGLQWRQLRRIEVPAGTEAKAEPQ